MKTIMSNQVLLGFLKVGLLDLNSDDTKLAKLQEAAGDLVGILKKAPGKTTPFSLIAFDPQAPVDDPVITEATAVLQKRWPTYINTFAGSPVTVIRAILLEALVQASGDEKVGLAFVSSARNVLPHIEAENEQSIWVDIVAAIEKQVDIRAELEWSTPDSINISSMPALTPAPIEITAAEVSVDNDLLETELQAAAGPNTLAGATNGNQYNSYNNNTQWVTDFGTRAASAISTALENVVEQSLAGKIDLSEPFNELSQAVSNYVGDAIKSVSVATSGLQRRTNLIWWKETLYSPSARVSYRRLSKPTAAVLMAFDLYQQVPTFSPASVVAFLYETVLSLPDIDPDEQLSIRTLLSELVTSPELNELRNVASQLLPDNGGRGPILGALGAIQSELNDDRLREKIGISVETVLTLPEWASWFFRELQAAEATQNVAKAKKRGS
ncbi:GTPase-associated system all-helical protein GASH [Xenorhabdus bovienii]|uniref:GTPase-associated system all-helical protein GASH n=1 Tax=Xenorhabdus bovienii TaxID=40576 RepID=UPI003DA4A550